MLIGAAFCPHPPLLVPALAAGAAGELDGLRAACDEAVAAVLAAEPDVLCVVGPAARTRLFADTAVGSLAGYGLDVRFGLRDCEAAPTMPLSLTVGAFLLAGRGPREVWAQSVADPADVALPRDRRLGLLVMGDGSARRVEDSPGAYDPAGIPFDTEISRLLGAADAAGILALDAIRADRALATGLPAWQVAAAAVDRPMRGSLLYADAPYDVGYFVATWEPR
jgi:hypothetical protein